MRILLISPTALNDFYQNKARAAPPYGLFRLKMWWENEYGYNVDILNTALYNYMEFDYSPYDVIGVSILHSTLENDLGVLHYVKSKNPRAVLVAGGIEATFNSEQVLRYSPVNIIKYGEGEGELNEEDYRRVNMMVDYGKMEWEKCWRYNKKHFGDIQRYVRITSDINYCPRKCLFCSSTNYYTKLKYLSADEVMEIIKNVSKLNPDMILIQSDDFLVGKGKQRLFGMNFVSDILLMVQTSVQVISDDVVVALKRIGVTKVSMGVESFSDKILREYNKRQTRKMVKNALNTLLDHNMEVFANIILTSPMATLKDVEYTIKDIKEYMLRGVEFGINLAPIKLPGSRLYNMDIGQHISKTVKVPHTDIVFEKSGNVYPSDTELADKIFKLEIVLEKKKLSSENLSKIIVKYF